MIRRAARRSSARRTSFLRIAVLLALALAMGRFPAGAVPAASAEEPRILVFSKTAGFRHDSIPAGIAAFRAMGEANGFAVDATEDATIFTPVDLARYRTVVFLLTTGDVLDDTQQSAFEAYLRAGGSWMGVHSASDTEHAWPWYGGLIGATFFNHSAIQPARVRVETRDHPSTSGLTDPWMRTDEWYNFSDSPRQNGNVILLTLDESSYVGGTMGSDHPIAWYHEYDGGRAFYTALGHTAASYGEPDFLAHLLGGLLYAMGPASPPPPDPDTSILLQGNRFRVEGTFRPSGGATSPAHLQRITSDTGYLWFFAPSNVEAVVKVLNGCGTNHRFWVFAGGLSNVKVDLTVTDTQNGTVQHYGNPQGTPFAPVQDTSAFATCP
jgi:type 1 glutamine amidotransferase